MHPEPQQQRLPERPRFKPWLRWTAGADDLVVEHGHVVHVFGGSRTALRLLGRLLPALDGTRDAAALAAATGATDTEVRGALRRLLELGLLLDGADPAHASSAGAHAAALALAASGLDLAPGEVRRRLDEADLVILGRGRVGAMVGELLHAAGVARIRAAGWAAASALPPHVLAIATAAPDESAALAAWNETAVAAGRAWLPVLPYDGRIVAVGPLVVAGETACAECFRIRRAAASGYGAEFDRLDSTAPRAGGGPALDAVAAGIAATVALRWLALRDHDLPGTLFTVERAGLALSEHRVHRVPRCPVCSDARRVAVPLPWFKQELEVAA